MLCHLVGNQSLVDLDVVVLHGYAMQPEDLAPFARSLGVNGRFRFPRGLCAAPGGGRSWWPIDETSRSARIAAGPRDLSAESPAKREPARKLLARLLRDGAMSNPTSRTVLAGFSQGGMLACDTLLNKDVEVDGLALFSSSLIALEEWDLRRERLAGLPVLVSHGRLDQDLHFGAGQSLCKWLTDAGAATQWVPFEGGHEIPLHVWREFRRFLRTIKSRARNLHPGAALKGGG